MKESAIENRTQNEDAVKRAAHFLIRTEDFKGLERLWARLDWQSFGDFLATAFDLTIEESKDVELLHALRFARHIDAMGECGRKWRG